MKNPLPDDQTNRPPAGVHASLRIMATTDVHMHLTGFDYYADRADATVGLTRTATLIRQARTDAASRNITTLLMDNGDGLQGNPMGEVAAGRTTHPHPLMQVFRHLQYDVIGLGNHDFNFGLKALAHALDQAPCPVVCSNSDRIDGPVDPAPYAVLDRTVAGDGQNWPIRVGVVSFVPPQTARWDDHLLSGRIATNDILNSAAQQVAQLRTVGCDLIVALAHTGLGSAVPQPDLENAAIPLAAVDGIDVVITGHTHLHLPGPEHAEFDHVDCVAGTIHAKPAIMAGSDGTHLGLVDLDLRSTDAGGWEITQHHAALHAIARRVAGGAAEPLVQEDPALVELLAPHHCATRSHMCQPVGHVDQALHSYFSFFAPDRSLAIVAAAQAAALRQNLAGSGYADLPVLSAVAPGKFGGRSGPSYYTDVPAGPVSLRHVADLHVFPNTLQAVVLSGAQVLDWLETSASLFHRIVPLQSGQMLIDPTVPGYFFDVLHGLEYKIDPSRSRRYGSNQIRCDPDACRILSPTYKGVTVAHDQMFVVALNSYRANGGGDVAALADARQIPLPRLTIRDALAKYLGNSSMTDPLAHAPPVWQFAPLPGTHVTAVTGPGALKHLNELKDRDIVATGTDMNGFITLRIGL